MKEKKKNATKRKKIALILWMQQTAVFENRIKYVESG